MEILSWNCRGLGRKPTICSLNYLSRMEEAEIIFLMETKCQSARIEGIRRKLKLQSCFNVDSKGASGGLALLWKANINIWVLASGPHFIDSKVSLDNGSFFYMTAVYGSPIKEKRQQVWEDIIALSMGRNEDWICYGDFNSFLSWHEKEGGDRSGKGDIAIFRHMVDTCELLELESHGPAFTWNNKRKGAANIRIKLDRAFSNLAWRRTYSEAVVFVKATVNSDHAPLIIDTEGGKAKGVRPFSFESMWFRHPDCKPIAIKA
ncbi:uncharacterized protein LOC122655670 [Telopea speciosissima]|uniref:uncharacterized protein LOC122655670 n=1 Tax=Telopea speciosissima TaxID=54955 RepID=UPI001CC41AC8|nr:uncharacterized protein LOC122655670 [Telopea speciosissima]